jgi:hypothetical protein
MGEIYDPLCERYSEDISRQVDIPESLSIGLLERDPYDEYGGYEIAFDYQDAVSHGIDPRKALLIATQRMDTLPHPRRHLKGL